MKSGRPIRLALPMGVALLAGCTTFERDLPVQGGTAADFRGRYVVVGIESRATTVSPPRGQIALEQRPEVRVDAPLETQTAIVSLSGWDLGYGFGDANSGSLPDQDPLQWRPENAYLGVARVDVSVIRIGEPERDDRGVMIRPVYLRVSLRLSDRWQDKPWFGTARYQLIFLGCASGTTC